MRKKTLRKILKRAGLGVLCLLAYYVLFQTFYNMVAFESIFPYESVQDALTGISINLPPIVCIYLLTLLIVFKIKCRTTWKKVCIDTSLCTAALVLTNCLFPVLMHSLGLNQYANVNWAGSAFNAIFIFLGVEMAYYIHNFKRQLIESEANKRRAIQYKYDALKAQVNPHFLFNSLNILNSLISVDSSRLGEFVKCLSDVYRYVMTWEGQDLVPLAEELRFVKSYISILELRYFNQFEVEFIDMEAAGGEVYIVPYTLQLLIENITKHNVISTRHPMKVKIRGLHDRLEVSNPVNKKKDTSESTKFGLRYLKELYASHDKEFVTTESAGTFTAGVPYVKGLSKHLSKVHTQSKEVALCDMQ